MKIGFMVPRESDFSDGRDPYPRLYEMCQLAEELGFDFGTFTHHRFSPDRPYLSSPFVIMSAVAAQTTRLKLVTTIFILPLYQPLDVAEAVASLDQVSGGRVVLGVGAGYRPYEAAAVQVPFGQRVPRMVESIEVLRRAWADGPASFAGEYFSFENVEVVPKPVQRPGPPIWLGALESKPVERAGRIADGWIAPSLQSLDTLRERAAGYRAAATTAGRTPVICLERDAAVSADAGRARTAWLERNAPMALYYRDQGASLPDVPATGNLTYENLGPGRAIAGSPDDCIAELLHCRDVLGCEYVQLMNMGLGPSYGHPGSYDTELEGLKLFGSAVLPALR